MFGHAVNKEYLFLPKGQLDTEYQLSAKHGRLQRNSHVASVVLRLYERRARYLTTSSPLSIMGSNASLWKDTSQETEQNKVRSHQWTKVKRWIWATFHEAIFSLSKQMLLLYINALEVCKWGKRAETQKKLKLFGLAQSLSPSLPATRSSNTLRTQSASPCAAAWPRKQPGTQLWTQHR